MATINGTNSANNLTGTALADFIYGRNGNDYIDGGDGDDYIDGGNDNDTLKGGLGKDRMLGGSGADRLNGGDGDDTLDGGTGVQDWAEFDGGAAVNVDLTLGIATGQGSDTILNIENILGSGFGDTLKGNSGSNAIFAGGGNDTIIATLGVDILAGDAGVDLISFAQLGSAAIVNLATGTYTSGTASGTLSGIENVTGTALADTIVGDSGDNVIDGGNGSDSLNGGAGIDTYKFSGTSGAPYNQGGFINLTTGVATTYGATDTITNFENVTASDYSDYITGNAGNNSINAGGGTDTIYATQGVDSYDGGAGGFDAVYFSNQPDATASLMTGSYSFDVNNYGTMTNIEHLVGGSGNDSLTGDNGANKLDGAAGNDTLAGGLGNDQLWGGAGSDLLVADGGDDTLNGNYSMQGYGDAASDTFKIMANAHNVSIGDFKIGVDKLDFTDFNLGNSSYWTASAVQSSPAITTLTLTGQAQEVVTVTLQGVSAGSTMSLNDMIGGDIGLIPAQWVNPNGNGLADIFQILPQHSGVQHLNSFEDGLDRLDLTFLNQPDWQGAQGGASDGSTLFDFWNTTSGDHFQLQVDGVGFGLITQPDIII
ncbi:MAG: calcium-binding protein [Micropepsaceae bacterium]